MTCAVAKVLIRNPQFRPFVERAPCGEMKPKADFCDEHWKLVPTSMKRALWDSNAHPERRRRAWINALAAVLEGISKGAQ